MPLAVIAGKNYGCGSSRDWAAKGVALLGVKAVIAESFERIHRTYEGGRRGGRADGTQETVPLTVRLDTDEDLESWRHGGIMPRVWRDYVNGPEPDPVRSNA